MTMLHDRNRPRMKRLLALLLIASTVVAHAADTARSRLDAFAGGLHSLTGRFTQTLTGGEGEPPKTSAGVLALEAPRQFRWETQTPYRQLIVADGSRVWLYDPELEQVTVRVQSSEEAHSPLTVLTDLKQIDREFKVSEEGARDGLLWLRLTSTARDPQFEYADLGFDAQGLARMQFRDALGALTDIRFSDWRRNVPLPPDTFTFTPPPGVDVIGDLPVITTQPLSH